MEDEMGKLDKTLSTVMDFSDKVSDALQEKREQISKLSGVHILLQKVLFLKVILLHVVFCTLSSVISVSQ